MAEARTALSTLYTTLVDSLKGYEEARKDAGQTGLITLFDEMLALRRQAIAELEPVLVAHGAEPDRDGSFMSTVHKTVISIQSMLTDLNESVLPGFIDGERRVLETYDEALAATTDESGREVLLRQRALLVERIAEMERRRQKAA